MKEVLVIMTFFFQMLIRHGNIIFLILAGLLFFGATSLGEPAAPLLRASASTFIPPDISSNKNSSTPSSSLAEKKMPARSQVFAVSDEQAITAGWKINPMHVQKMLDLLLCAVTRKKTSLEAWRSLIQVGEHGDCVGIKIATEPGLLSGTHHELVSIIVKELLDAGVKSEKIIVWDRRHDDLETAGYLNLAGLHLQWIEQGTGYDSKALFYSPIIGKLVYGDLEFKESPRSFQEWVNHTQEQFSNDSHYALILSHHLDKIINIPSLCDSTYSGINGALANMTLGVIDNWRRLTKPPYFGDPAIAQLYAAEFIQHKVVLTLMDGLALEYAGGPGPNPSHTIVYGTLFASRDPVAIDATAVRLIDEQRCIAGLPKLGGKESHVLAAEAAGLGNAAEEKIEFVRLR